MSDFFDKLKKVFVIVFPPIVMPQKRYIVLGITIVYLVTKQIVLFTPTKVDDQLLEEIHEVAFQLVENNSPNSDDAVQAE
jgi:hypothetical protein